MIAASMSLAPFKYVDFSKSNKVSGTPLALKEVKIVKASFMFVTVILNITAFVSL